MTPDELRALATLAGAGFTFEILEMTDDTPHQPPHTPVLRADMRSHAASVPAVLSAPLVPPPVRPAHGGQ
jgi:hypothetical protein